MFFTRFIVSNIFGVLLIGIILLFKKILYDKVSLKFQYQIWFIFLISLIIVFLPISLLDKIKFGDLKQNSINNNSDMLPITAPDIQNANDWLYDFTELTYSVNETKIDIILFVIWVSGSLLVLGYYFLENRKIRVIRHFHSIPSKHIIDIFESCKKSIVGKRKVHLIQSDMINTPMSFGIRTSYIVMPTNSINRLSDKEIKHIILHELIHVKNKDSWINFFICIEQVLYWFNPFVWFAFSKLRCDREVYCDWSVLNIYDTQEERLGYGDTLLQFANVKRDVLVHTVNGLFDAKKQLKYRIERIANYKNETKCSRMLGNSFIVILSFLVMLQTPVFSALSSNVELFYKPKKSLNFLEQDYSEYFANIQGCAVVYDLEANIYNVYKKSDITKRIAPCSTYKIYSAINALERGIITPNNNVLKWDLIKRTFSTWNKDQNLNSAMKNSVNWYFQYVDDIVGTEELNEFYSNIGYGNGYVNDTEYYWNGNGLRISPLEQVELLVKLYNNEFNFEIDNVNTLKDSMLISESDNIKLYGKTGTGRIKENDVIGWFIGVIETDNNTYFFAFNLQDDKNANGNNATKIAYSVFKAMGIKLD